MTDPGYAQAAAQSFTVTEVSLGTLVLRGPCPRCNAVIDIPLVHEIFRSSRLLINPNPPAYRPGPRDEYVEPMMCTCVDAHPDRPDDQYGCGAYWTLTITKRPS